MRLFRQGVTYYEDLRKQTNLPILTTFLVTQKVYVVNSPELISQIHRQGKRVDGTLPFLYVVCGKFFGMHGEDLAGLMRNATTINSLRYDLKTMEHTALEVGTASSIEIYRNICCELADILNNVASQGPEKVSLQRWLQKTFTLATGRGIFGRGNPLDRSEDLVDCVWAMENGLKELTMLPFQSITARKAVAARERLVQAFMNDNVGDFTTSDGAPILLFRKFNSLANHHGVTAEFRARYAVGIFTGFVINTMPAAFWIISLLLENKDLAERIRLEVRDVVTIVGPDEFTLDPASLRVQCRLLHSTCREVLRYISSSISSFLVNDNIHLDDGLILKKGALIQIAATAIHPNTAIWGPTATKLDPERFLRQEKVHPSANRVFGGGSSMCPGRHLALDELLTFTAMFALSFAISRSPISTPFPGQKRGSMLSVKKPDSDVQIHIARRADNSMRWKFSDAS
ncbi:cytochrome P450 [Colletotrichum phormii]|uniref:Cytochrome P450 n=1 Tax=Colletotrichum phormii TaxID=359342 RepID=A0AAI9ZEP5_9PEZI|nr:cytochrome P450 [Colletotrichum phormii]KAK1623165.1 cytochrome P450 [Colletotrichum phormii]